MNSVWFNLLFLIIGFILVVKGGDYFVSSAVSLAKKTQIPAVIIGATIVSIATTLPELLVSLISSINGQFEMAVGNAVGTIIANISLICGISIIFLPMAVKKTSNIKYYILIFLSVFLLICGINFGIDWYESLILLLIFVGFIVINVMEARKEMKTFPQEEDEDFMESKEEIMPWKKIIPLFLIGALSIGFGAMTMVNTASNLAKFIGVSEEFISLTIIALGTSLPELTTTIIAIRKKESSLGYGNIIGANIINSSLLMGATGLVAGTSLPMTKQTVWISMPLMLIVTCIFILPLIFKSKTYRWQGIILLILYCAYIVFLILSTLGIVLVK